MRAPRVVLDTNVVVAGLRSRQGTAFRLLTEVGKGKFGIALSVPRLRRSAEMTHLCSLKVDHPRSVPARSCGGGWGPALEAPRRAPLALRPKAGVQSAVVPIVVPGVLARATAAGHF